MRAVRFRRFFGIETCGRMRHQTEIGERRIAAADLGNAMIDVAGT